MAEAEKPAKKETAKKEVKTSPLGAASQKEQTGKKVRSFPDGTIQIDH